MEKQFVSFVSSSELFWNAMEKQVVSRTRTTKNDLGKPQLLDKIFTSLHYMKTTRSDEGLMVIKVGLVIFVSSTYPDYSRVNCFGMQWKNKLYHLSVRVNCFGMKWKNKLYHLSVRVNCFGMKWKNNLYREHALTTTI